MQQQSTPIVREPEEAGWLEQCFSHAASGEEAKIAPRFSLREITLEQVCDFRRSNTPALWENPDHWDKLGQHFGLYKNDRLTIVFRMNKPHEGQLPVNEYLRDTEIHSNDVQFGRLMVATDERRGRSCARLLIEFNQLLKQVEGRTFITPLDFEDGGLSERTFRKFGFEPLAAAVELSGGRTLKPMIRPEMKHATPQLAA